MVRNTAAPQAPTRSQFVLQEGVVRIGPLGALPDLMRDLGCDPDSVFARAGFDSAQFTDPDAEIPYVAASRLLASCVVATGCDQLGLLLGERACSSSLGLAGFMLRSAPDVGAALRGLVRNLDLHDRGAKATLVIKDREAYVGYAIYLSGVQATDQIYDLSMAVVCKIMRDLCGVNWNPTEVLLARPRPQHTTLYRRFFRAPIRFDADQSAVVFPTHWLAQRIATADPLLHRHLEIEANFLHASQPTSLRDFLRQQLRRSLIARKSSAADIARQLGMHERTLNRKLREEGTSFRKELEDIRYDFARRLLADSILPLARIAEELDYADSTAFIRAFKRWSGTSPGEWRRHNKGGPE